MVFVPRTHTWDRKLFTYLSSPVKDYREDWFNHCTLKFPIALLLHRYNFWTCLVSVATECYTGCKGTCTNGNQPTTLRTSVLVQNHPIEIGSFRYMEKLYCRRSMNLPPHAPPNGKGWPVHTWTWHLHLHLYPYRGSLLSCPHFKTCASEAESAPHMTAHNNHTLMSQLLSNLNIQLALFSFQCRMPSWNFSLQEDCTIC